MVLITHPLTAVLESPVIVTYEVCQPKIIVHSPASTSSILCIPELLNIGVTIHAVLCMHNASNVPAYFLWGAPVGKQKNCIDVRFNPKAGVIKPRDILKITISLKPQETGILEQIHVPCFVGRVDEPVMLAVMCAVDNIHVCFTLPMHDGRHRRIPWPPQIIDEYSLQSYSLPLFALEEDPITTSSFWDIPHIDKKPCLQEILKAKADYAQATKDDNLNTPSPFDINLSRLLNINCYEQTPQTLSNESVVAKPALIDHFGSELILEEYHIQIRDVPIKTRNPAQIGNVSDSTLSYYSCEENNTVT